MTRLNSPNDARKRNAVVVLTHHPDPGIDANTPLAHSMGTDTVRPLQAAMLQDIADKLHVWSDFATCFLAVEDAVKAKAPSVIAGYDTLGTVHTPSFKQLASKLLEQVRNKGEYERIVFIEGFAPTLPVSIPRDAFEWLWERDVVIGPSLTGGCYLLGVRDWDNKVFPDCDWHTGPAFHKLVVNAKDLGLQIQLVDFWFTVSKPSDFVMLHYHLAAQAATHFNTQNVAMFEGRHTWQAMQALLGTKLIEDDPRFQDGGDGAPAGNGAPGGSGARFQPKRVGAPAPMPGEIQIRRGKVGAPKLPTDDQ